ncbi:MAG: diacylglycerol kinase family lipid kinase [Coriobacteriia bacterium]|nr:diacylglycerol kinase family lipid kinase [Coriobacteriia bacterium]
MNGPAQATIIANPASQNGNGAKAAQSALALLQQKLGENHVDLQLTQHPRHAEELAQSLPDHVRTVIALGGDGLVNEVANGLMARRAAQGTDSLPALAVIPSGSGNDYAATLGMSGKMPQAVDQILQGRTVRADVGCCNGRHFVETLSFGVDAAIALDTVERRKRTGHSGTLLYAESGIDQILHHRDERAFKLIANGTEHTGTSLTFAVQLGRTYGGGFQICPDARIDDGLFDLCIAQGPLSLSHALVAFARAKFGAHANMKCMKTLTARELRIEFDQEPPAQMDGEKVQGRIFDVSLTPNALPVICAR